MHRGSGTGFINIELPVVFKGNEDGLWDSFQMHALVTIGVVSGTVIALFISAKATLSLEFHAAQLAALGLLFYSIHMVRKSNRIKGLISEKDFTCLHVDHEQIIDFMTFYPDIGVVNVGDIETYHFDDEHQRITFKLTRPYKIRRRSNAVLRFTDLLHFAYEGSLFPRTYKMDASHLGNDLHKFLFILDELKPR